VGLLVALPKKACSRLPSCSPTAAHRSAYGSNTSGGGERRWVKFHFKTCQGIKIWTNRKDVGELELNRNPENYFVEIEQASWDQLGLPEREHHLVGGWG
jgi:catalase